jgi:hypothetical protein
LSGQRFRVSSVLETGPTFVMEFLCIIVDAIWESRLVAVNLTAFILHTDW